MRLWFFFFHVRILCWVVDSCAFIYWALVSNYEAGAWLASLYVTCQIREGKEIGSQLLLASTSSHVQLWRGSEKGIQWVPRGKQRLSHNRLNPSCYWDKLCWIVLQSCTQKIYHHYISCRIPRPQFNNSYATSDFSITYSTMKVLRLTSGAKPKVKACHEQALKTNWPMQWVEWFAEKLFKRGLSMRLSVVADYFKNASNANYYVHYSPIYICLHVCNRNLNEQI